jgi:hypothetical protein
LFLVKRAPAPAGRTKAEELAALGIVDRALPLYLRKSALRAFVLGPCDHTAVGAAVCAGAAAGVAVE